MTSFVTNVDAADETEFSELNLVLGRGDLVDIANIPQVLSMVVGDDWLAQVNVNVCKSSLVSFVDRKKYSNRFTHKVNNYGYYLRRNKTNVSTRSKPATIDFGRVLTSPDGVYRWIMYLINGHTIRICCKHVYPTFGFVSSQKSIICELIDTLPNGQRIMVLGGGEFVKHTKFADGLPSYTFTINTVCDDTTRINVLRTQSSIGKFILFVFRRLGPPPDQGVALYNVSTTDPSVLDSHSGITLAETRYKFLEYANIYGYTVYEFGPSLQHRRAFKRVQPLAFAAFETRLRLIDSTTACLTRLNVFLHQSPDVEGPRTPAEYKTQQKSLLLEQTNMMSNRELSGFRLPLYHWQTMVHLRSTTINVSCSRLFNTHDDDHVDVLDRMMTPIRQAVVLGSNPLRVCIEFVAV
jgi:hypothetical protein